VCEDLTTDKSVAGRSASLAGLNNMLAMPVIENATLKAVVAMYI
jgi:hypothetical protein